MDNWNIIISNDLPPSPDFTNVNNQSSDQTQAFETWVNMAVGMLNEGKNTTEVLAKLAYDGCPDPQSVLSRAQQQSVQEPHEDNMDSVNRDIYRPAPDAMGTEVQSRVIFAGVEGTEVGRYETYGQEFVRVAFDNGDTKDVLASDVSPATDLRPDSVRSIEDFIEALPAPNMLNRTATAKNWKVVKDWCESHLPHAKSDDERNRLAQIHVVAKQTLTSLTETVEQERSAHTEDNPTYSMGLRGEWTDEDAREAGQDVTKIIREGSAIWVSELSPAILDEPEIVADSARSYAYSTLGNNDKAIEAFVSACEQHRQARVASVRPVKETVSPEYTPDVLDDALFLS